MSQPKTTRIPAPFYAAAGAGEMAYRQLLKLPALASDLGDKAANNGAELRTQVVATTAGLQKRATAALRSANQTAVRIRTSEFDSDRLREIAMRNAASFIAGAQAAQERAVTVYGQLVARGEKVVGTGVVQAADTVNADIEATEKPELAAKSNGKIEPAKTEDKTTAKKTVAAKKTTTPAK